MTVVQGYFKDNTFVNESNIVIPNGCPVLVTILEPSAKVQMDRDFPPLDEKEPESPRNDAYQRQKKAFQEFLRAWKEIDEPLTAVFDQAVAEGMHFRETGA
jgi:hypothetical protein